MGGSVERLHLHGICTLPLRPPRRMFRLEACVSEGKIAIPILVVASTCEGRCELWSLGIHSSAQLTFCAGGKFEFEGTIFSSYCGADIIVVRFTRVFFWRNIEAYIVFGYEGSKNDE